jgi:hypothetical protein
MWMQLISKQVWGQGAVIRNCRGEVIAGGSWPLFQTLDATTAEALALRHGLLLLEEIGYSPTVVESDCLELINNCSGETEVWGPHAHILPDCLHISRRISNISFKHCLREANNARWCTI